MKAPRRALWFLRVILIGLPNFLLPALLILCLWLGWEFWRHP